MIKSAESTAKNTSKTAKINPTENFAQIPNKLIDLSLTGTRDVPAAAFHTLVFMLRLPPETDITPDNISRQMELRSTVPGGKWKKPETIRAEFRKLIKAGYMFSERKQAENGGSIPSEYGINYTKILGGVGENSPGGKTHNKHTKSNQKTPERGVGENSPGGIYKERASSNTGNTGKDSIQNLFSSVAGKKSSAARKIFSAAVPTHLRDKETPKMINCLVKAFEYDYFKAYDFMTSAFVNESIDDPIGYIWGAIKKINEKRSDTQSRQYQTRPPSGQAPPAKPQKSIANKEKIVSPASIDSEFEKRIASLSKDEKIKLIEKIIPRLNPWTLKRYQLLSGVDEGLLDYYFGVYQIKYEILELGTENETDN